MQSVQCTEQQLDAHRSNGVRASGYTGTGMRYESSIPSGLSTVLEEVRAIGGVPIGAVRYPELDRRREYSGLGEKTGTVPRCEQVIGGGYGARPKEARTTGYYGYIGVPQHVVCADQATVDQHIGWAS